MKIVFLAFLVFGTASPNANAALNIVRSNKARCFALATLRLLKHRLQEQVIYSQQTRSPNFYDGSRWTPVNDPSAAPVPLYGRRL